MNSYQDSLKQLYDVNTQISSGSKIQNSYEDSSIYVDTMRLNDEIYTFEQVKDSSSKAQTFANNTDAAMNDLDSTLTNFKSKLIQAANGVNSETSLGAIADDLTGMKEHLKNIANTSINGQFLFSGSALDKKPISDDGSYHGNGESMTSLVGSGVQLPYNIDGESLFLGDDSDYEKMVSTNVKLYSDDEHKNLLKGDDTVKDMMSANGGGDEQDNAYFYIQGKNSDGSSFKKKVEVDSDDTIDNLLQGIKASYNPPESVDVTLNDYGQIEIRDNNSGHKTLDFSMVASYDDKDDIDDLTNVVSFVKSGYSKSPDAASEEVSFDRNYFDVDGNTLKSSISQIDETTNQYATSKTKLVDSSGLDSLSGETLDLKLDNINGDSKSATINFGDTSTFTIDGNTYNIYDAKGEVVSADDMTYQQLNDVVAMIVSDSLPITNDADGYNKAVETSRYSVDVSLDYRGKMQIADKLNPSTSIKFSMYDSSSDDFSSTATGNSLSFMSNNAITADEPNVDFFKDLDEMIEAVRSGNFSMDSSSDNPRNIGIENSIARIDHISDHTIKQHTKVGSYSNALADASQRADLLSVNVKTVKSEIADVDIGEAYTEFTQLSNSYEATLSTVAKINSMSLLNYM
jgi:flagellar hook-associated protein 3 FlgL